VVSLLLFVVSLSWFDLRSLAVIRGFLAVIRGFLVVV
jgi:hypothetical protein